MFDVLLGKRVFEFSGRGGNAIDEQAEIESLVATRFVSQLSSDGQPVRIESFY